MKETALDKLFYVLHYVAEQRNTAIANVDANAGNRADLWGERAIHITFLDGTELWIQEAKEENKTDA